jgi:hypothetical protein
MKQPISVLKNFFSAFKMPTGSNFGDLIDSFFHKDSKIPASQVEGWTDDSAVILEPGVMELPELGNKNKSTKVLGGATGKTYTYKGTQLPILPNNEGILFWNATPKVWGIQDQAPIPKGEDGASLLEVWSSTSPNYPYKINVQVRDSVGKTFVSLVSNNTFALTDATKWKPITIDQKTLLELPNSVDKTGTIITGRAYSNTGALVSRGTAHATEKIVILEGADIFVQATSTLNTVHCVFFSEDDLLISAIRSSFSTPTKIVTPLGAKKFAASGDLTTPLIVEMRALTYKQLKTGYDQTAVNTVEIVNNKTDLQALKNAEIKELYTFGYFDTDITPQLVAGYWSSTGSPPAGSVGYLATPKIEILNDTLLVTNTYRAGFQDRIVFFKEDGTFLSQLQKSHTYEEILYPAGAKFFAISQGAELPVLKIVKYGWRREIIDNISPRIDAVEDMVKTGGLGVANSYANRFYDLGNGNRYRMSTLNKGNYTILWEGQSNAADPGYAPYSKVAELGLPNTTQRVVKWNGTTFVHYDLPANTNWGPYWSVLYRLDAYLTVPIRYYNNGVGGTDLYSAWNPDTKNINALANKSAIATTAIKDTFPDSNIKCIVWIQGESDQESPKQEAYYQNLKNFIAFRRGTIGNSSVPFVVVGLHPYNSIGTLLPNRKAIFDAQKKVCEEDPHAYFIDPTVFDFSGVDSQHYDAEYCEKIGNLIFNTIKDF